MVRDYTKRLTRQEHSEHIESRFSKLDADRAEEKPIQTDGFPHKVDNYLERELEPGEEVLWRSKPVHVKYLVMTSFGIYLFAIPWTAFSIFWMAGAAGMLGGFENAGSGPAGYFWAFGLPFFFIGIAMLSAPYWVYRKIRNTYYVITDRRAIILTGGSKRINVESFGADKLSDFQKTYGPTGSGKIEFSRTVTYDSDGDRNVKHKGFYGIEDVNEVEALLKRIVH